VESAVVNGTDIHSHNAVVSSTGRRMTVADTDRGAQIKEEIKALEELLRAYRSGLLVETL
jgi:fructose-1,6-bisphosphatase-3